MQRCEASGTDVRAYGDDLPFMAEIEASRNLWAVRFIYLHLLRNALCLRPPWSMVEHIGFDEQATNAGYEGWLKNPDLKPAPEIPTAWPPPVENPACAYLHRSATAHPPAESQSLVPSFGFFFSRVRKWMGFD
jgi:hypothetical protein